MADQGALLDCSHISVLFTRDDFEIRKVDAASLSPEERTLYEKYGREKSRFVFELAFCDATFSESVSYLRFIAKEYVKVLVSDPAFLVSDYPQKTVFTQAIIENVIANAPYAIGSENITPAWVNGVTSLLDKAYIEECTKSGKTPSAFLSRRNGPFIPSRIYFHLVENKQQDDYPFAFLATYTSIRDGAVIHTPLKNALTELRDQNALRKLIQCITNAAKESSFLSVFLESGEIFYPIRFTNGEAYQFLKETSLYEKNGIVCRVPKWTNSFENRIEIDPQEKKNYQEQFFNIAVINSYTPEMIYHGVPITPEEAASLQEKEEGLEKIKGKWVEINHEQLRLLITEYDKIRSEGVSLIDLLRNKTGFSGAARKTAVPVEFSRKDFVEDFCNRVLYESEVGALPASFVDVLRPYQVTAFSWLTTLYKLGFGACLADDMGLGKTIEMLAFLQGIKDKGAKSVLLIVPPTLIGNWQSEIKRFAPDLDSLVLKGNNVPAGSEVCAYITMCSYQRALNLDYLDRVKWDVIVLDEAQAIKNYYTAISRRVKTLKGKMRIAMTGTPIENNLVDLWSIFDFINPGLLGTRAEFVELYKKLLKQFQGLDALKDLIRPFLLRRAKTDKSIIRDLPEKNEINVKIDLSKEQIALYKQVVDNLNENYKACKTRQEQRVYIITALTKLKQVCNHPAQYYGSLDYDPRRSGKFLELLRICESIYLHGEKVLVFSQFAEVIPALNNLLHGVFGQEGFVVDGSTPMEKRNSFVQRFQNGEAPYMVLSLKTAGVGLNLTAAQNVIHFDRWWNPATENQATDRTYRIGQKNNVTVYRFISSGTIEERINEMIESKQKLADTLIDGLDRNGLAMISNEELIRAAQFGGFEEE